MKIWFRQNIGKYQELCCSETDPLSFNPIQKYRKGFQHTKIEEKMMKKTKTTSDGGQYIPLVELGCCCVRVRQVYMCVCDYLYNNEREAGRECKRGIEEDCGKYGEIEKRGTTRFYDT